jgi:hypothetical protein
MCVACGGAGQPCCQKAFDEPPTCGAGAVCGGGPFGPACQPCGGDGQPCCASQKCNGTSCCWQNLCISEGQSCAGSTGACKAGQCECGKLNQSCCVPSMANPAQCTDPDTVCSPTAQFGVCARCGGPGQACCPGNRCPGACCVPNIFFKEGGTCVAGGAACGNGFGGGADGGVVLPSDGGVQDNTGVCGAEGACGNCGALGKPCCGNDGNPRWCSATGATCVFDGSYNCKACGGRDQPCCTPFTYGPMMGFFGNSSCNSPLVCNFSGNGALCGDLQIGVGPMFPGPIPVPPPFP